MEASSFCDSIKVGIFLTLSKESAAGFFVLLGILCVAYLTIKLGKMEFFNDNGYTVTASFSSVAGLRSGAEVQIAGVTVGRVKSIQLENARAIVALQIDQEVKLTDDVIASIKTSGLIGDKYVNLEPGGSRELLGNGGQITDTESAIDIEELISKYVFGKV